MDTDLYDQSDGPWSIWSDEGGKIQFGFRSDLSTRRLQKYISEHRKNGWQIYCGCCPGERKKMHIVLDSLQDKSDAKFGSRAETQSNTRKEFGTGYYLRRDHLTADTHSPNCPNRLMLRDFTKKGRSTSVREYSSSIFRASSDPLPNNESYKEGGAVQGAQHLTLQTFVNEVQKRAYHEASLNAGQPFGIPSRKAFLAAIQKQISRIACFKGGLTATQAAEKERVNLEFGFCSYEAFDDPLGPTEIHQVELDVAQPDSSTIAKSRLFISRIFQEAAGSIRRWDLPLSPPYFWLAAVSKSNRIVRYWQSCVTLDEGGIVPRDSDPEERYIKSEIARGHSVYKVLDIGLANEIIKAVAPEAGLLSDKCDFLAFSGKVLTVVEVVAASKTDDPAYHRRLLAKESRYLPLQIQGQLEYVRIDYTKAHTRGGK